MIIPHQNPSDESLGKLPAELGIAVGETAPDATVQEASGRTVRIAELVEQGPVLLVFYRGGWCPYCNFQIRELATTYPEYRKRGVTPVAVSVDRLERAADTKATYTIPFPVLSDPELHAHRAYRVIHHASDDEVAKLRSFGMDLEASSGQKHHVIAVPSLFLIDRGRVVRWSHVDPNYKVRPSTEQILAAIDRLGAL